jgi:Ca2+-binding EF-hand superfamily protein
MLAPEMPVMYAQGIRMERQKSLFGIFENEEVPESSDKEKQVRIRQESHLNEIYVNDAVNQLTAHSLSDENPREGVVVSKFHSIQSFSAAIHAMFRNCNKEAPAQDAVKDLYDTIGGGQGQIALKPLLCAAALLAKGSASAKIAVIFSIADNDGDGSLSFEELFDFFHFVFGNVMTRSVLGIMNAHGVPLGSSEQLAAATAKECMDMCDLDRNGCLSLEEFQRWFYRPRQKPSLVSNPFESR